MASNDIITEPRLRARGPIDSLSASVAYSSADMFTAGGCPACCSGLDPLLRDELRSATV